MIKGSREYVESQQEQIKLQFKPWEETVRVNSLKDYSIAFNEPGNWLMPENWLADTLRSRLATQESVVYIDLGCGLGVAVREAMAIAHSLGKDANLRALGVDIIPEDFENNPHLQFKEFVPEIVEDDIDTFKFPEAADLVTMHNVLLWTRDPLLALANAAAQTKVGGIICANNLYGIREKVGEYPYRGLFELREDRFSNKEYQGFLALNKPQARKDELVLRKTNPPTTTEEVLQIWFGCIPQLGQRVPALKAMRGFLYYYNLHKPLSTN